MSGSDKTRVAAVASDMERHILGHEGMEDSPVARWARELRGALGATMSRHESDAVADSTSDAMADEDREAAAWVREHGGLSHVKDIYNDLRAVVECLDIEWSESELHGLMDALDRRLMPEGCEWPRYESGEPVRIGGTIVDELGCEHVVASVEVFDDAAALHWSPSDPEEFVWLVHGQRVKRPEEVLASDGEPLEVWQTVWGIGRSQHEFEVLALNDVNPEVGNRFNVKCFDRDDDEECWCDPKLLTHTKPEPPDSWERLKSDIYKEIEMQPTLRTTRFGIELFVSNVVRRCRALAERERDE